ncbi:MAG TPA: GAF domain-containing protein [Terriglobales bacterium]|jgi:hypothetical protein
MTNSTLIPPFPGNAKSGSGSTTEIHSEPLRFPGEDGGRSLAEAAQRDLNAALQLLAERAQYITGASGAAIALRERSDMVCRASAGPSAPEIGAHLDVNTGLSGESVRTRQLLHCPDAENDPRVNHETCRMLGIGSLLVMPLLVGQEAIGLFELLSGKAHAFQDHDIAALERLGEMVLTAIDHARMSEHPVPANVEAPVNAAAANQVPIEKEQAVGTATPEAECEAPIDLPPSSLFEERGQIRNCEACGFPVSGQRRFCVDCESRQKGARSNADISLEVPGFLTQFDSEEISQPGWLRKHAYVVGTLLIILLTIGLFLWSR